MDLSSLLFFLQKWFLCRPALPRLLWDLEVWARASACCKRKRAGLPCHWQRLIQRDTTTKVCKHYHYGKKQLTVWTYFSQRWHHFQAWLQPSCGAATSCCWRLLHSPYDNKGMSWDKRINFPETRNTPEVGNVSDKNCHSTHGNSTEDIDTPCWDPASFSALIRCASSMPASALGAG